MTHLSEKQIWDEVFDGDVQSAIERTKAQRNVYGEGQYLSCALPQSQVLYLEPSLVSNKGHQLNLAGFYQQTLNKLGYSTSIIHGFRNSLSSQKYWQPYFLVKHHTMTSRNINSSSALALVEEYYYSEFQGILDLHRPLICIFATIRFTNFLAAIHR
jgi:hypothetical protein